MPTKAVLLNGVCLANGAGDGKFSVYFRNDKELYSASIWIDLRDTPKLEIWEYDCILEYEGETKPRIRTFTSADFDNAKAVELSFDNGNLIISKYF